MATYNKLVRDNIPDIIREDGKTPVTRTLSEEEFKVELKKKLVEEAQEFLKAESKHELIEEINDIQTLIRYIKKHFEITEDELASELINKTLSKGGFNNKVFLTEVKE